MPVRIYGQKRPLADCFKYRNKIGTRHSECGLPKVDVAAAHRHRQAWRFMRTHELRGKVMRFAWKHCRDTTAGSYYRFALSRQRLLASRHCRPPLFSELPNTSLWSGFCIACC